MTKAEAVKMQGDFQRGIDKIEERQKWIIKAENTSIKLALKLFKNELRKAELKGDQSGIIGFGKMYDDLTQMTGTLSFLLKNRQPVTFPSSESAMEYARQNYPESTEADTLGRKEKKYPLYIRAYAVKMSSKFNGRHPYCLKIDGKYIYEGESL